MADINAQQFGEHAQKYFSSNRSYKVLDSNPETQGCTWKSGGCGVAALGLHQALPGSEIHAMFDRGEDHRNPVAQHFVVKHQGTYYDADGASTRPQLHQRWKTEEGLKKPSVRRSSVDELMESGVPSGWNSRTKTETSDIVARHLTQ